MMKYYILQNQNSWNDNNSKYVYWHATHTIAMWVVCMLLTMHWNIAHLTFVYCIYPCQVSDIAINNYIIAKKKGCFDSIWLPQFHTSSASLSTVETHCLLYIPNSD